MHAAVNNRLLAVWGLLNLLTQLRDLQRSTCTAVYGTVRTVVWADGRGNPPSDPIVPGSRLWVKVNGRP